MFTSLTTLTTLFAAALFCQTFAQEPLASKHFTWPDIPYQVSGDDAGKRGPQYGINLCNSTTENQRSICQTSFVNDITDFCMWAPPTPNATIGDTEAIEVAWCTKKGHGTRIIPSGALSGVQFLYAKNYLQVVGWIDMTAVSIQAGDSGGELDPYSFDNDGNPLGGILFSNGFGQTVTGFKAQLSSKQLGSTNYTQVINWVDFIGSANQNPTSLGRFCIKTCNPTYSDGAHLCDHRYDKVGCDYNAPADYTAIQNNFLVCDSDDMSPPGVYTSNGQVTTWAQPLNDLPITSVPYTPTLPASSNCQTFASSDLFAATAVPSVSTNIQASPSTQSGLGSSSSRSGGAPSPSQTASSDSVASGPTASTIILSIVLLLAV